MFRRLRQQFFAPKPPATPPVFALPEGVRIYAVGDIHGRSGLLQKMLTAIEQDAAQNPKPQTIQVFLGDYIDRGADSRGVVELLLTPSPGGHQRICLLGNHEETLIQFLKVPETLRSWANFGGYATLASYGVAIPELRTPENLVSARDKFQQNLPAAHEAFFRNLRLTYQCGDYLFVHAGILPSVALHEQTRASLLWIREPFLNHEGFFGHYVVHGHTPVASPEIRSNRANLDITAAAEDSLCCLVLEGVEQRIMLIKDRES